LGALGYQQVHSLLRVILRHTEQLCTLIAILNENQLELLVLYLSEEALLSIAHLIWPHRDDVLDILL